MAGIIAGIAWIPKGVMIKRWLILACDELILAKAGL
jgi:hypothetical protein